MSWQNRGAFCHGNAREFGSFGKPFLSPRRPEAGERKGRHRGKRSGPRKEHYPTMRLSAPRGPVKSEPARNYCRNPKCRSKLSAPVTNPRDAFCTRGCHGSFYLKRCRVCEEPIEQGGRRPRLICRKSKCRNAWEGDFPGGRYHPTSSRENSSKTTDFIELETGTQTVRRSTSLAATGGPTRRGSVVSYWRPCCALRLGAAGHEETKHHQRPVVVAQT